jgi:glycogen debranching enzyme
MQSGRVFMDCIFICGKTRWMAIAVLAAISMLLYTAGATATERSGKGGMSRESAKGLSAPEERAVRERWEIRVPAGSQREYIYTNKVAAHFSGETVGPNSRSYHGLYVSMHEYVDSWELSLGGRPLGSDEIGEAFVYPHVLYRSYPKRGVLEEIFLPDSLNALAVRLHGASAGEITPWMDMRHIWQVPKPEYRIIWSKAKNMLLISRADEPFPEGRPAWIAITANVPMDFASDERFRPTEYPKDAARRAMARTNPFTPGHLTFARPTGAKEPVTFVFGLGSDEKSAAAEAEKLLNNFTRLKEEKLRSIEGSLRVAEIITRDENINKAFRWARVSMNNLIMNQRGRGIYAGFYWFPNYWGRDSFISLPGACLATGQFDVAREILVSFMSYQETDTSSARLGRFPNIVNPDNLQYAGVDGTWWLVRAAWKYYLASGDTSFLQRQFPAIRLAIEGALAKAVDEKKFLTHGDGETWMDAGGETHPYSPRGDRAVEVQALFHHGLLVGAAWARTLAAPLLAGDEKSQLEDLAEKWELVAGALRENFNELFWNGKVGYLYDHLNEDGSPDWQIRPNAILALWVSLDRRDFEPLLAENPDLRVYYVVPLVDWDKGKAIMQTALETIILPHGVTSLSPKDPQFHQHHLAFERYFFDEAYHNGDVWEWLTGPTVSCLLDVGERDKAWRLVEPLVDEILNGACVGTLREIRDGVETPGKIEFGGATSQAWSLAEFIRVCLAEFVSFEGRPVSSGDSRCRYIGIRGWTAGKAVADPARVPREWKETRFKLPFVCAAPNKRGLEKPELSVREGSVKPSQRTLGVDNR